LTKAAQGHISLLIAQVIYALTYSIAKDLMPTYLNPVVLVFCRITGACLLFWLLSAFVPTQKVERKDLIKISWLAICGAVANQLFFIYGLSKTTPINSSIIMISNPIMVLFFTLMVFKERITIFKVGGLILAIAGAVMILSYRGNFELGSDTIAGDLMTLINSAFWAIFVVAVTPLIKKYNTTTVMRWVFLFGSIYILPIGISDTVHTNWHNFNTHAFLALGFVVVITTFIAYLLNVFALQALSPNTVSAYIYLQPLLASLFAILGGKDVLTTTKLISGILIIFGLYLINIKTKKATT